jgi:hypothetical protein
MQFLEFKMKKMKKKYRGFMRLQRKVVVFLNLS